MEIGYELLKEIVEDTNRSWQRISSNNNRNNSIMGGDGDSSYVEIKEKSKGKYVCRGRVCIGGCSSMDVIDCLWEVQNLRDIDSSIGEAFRIRTYSDDTINETEGGGLCTYYEAFKGLLGFPGRDLVLVGGKRVVSDGHIVSCSRSIEEAVVGRFMTTKQRNLIDSGSRKVRAHLEVMGIDCRDRRDSEGNNVVDVCLVNDIDIKEPWAPSSVIKRIQIDQISKIYKLKEGVERLLNLAGPVSASPRTSTIYNK
eukprot:Filipodium_phascolosomae@DN1560_c0_g1_i2.p1